MSNLKVTLLTAAVMTAVSFAGAQADIKIGVAGPITGQYAVFGEQMQKGAELAVVDLNAAGGVLGQKIKLIVYDDACDATQAVEAANKAVSDGIVLQAGHFCSSTSIPASEVYNEEGILQISPASTNPKYTDEGGPLSFRVCGRDDQQGEVAGMMLMKEFGSKKIAFLHDKTAYGKGLADATLENYRKAGGKEAAYIAYTPGESDYSALITLLKSKSIDVIYLGGYHTEGALMIRQAHEQGFKPQMVSGDALVTSEYWDIAGPAAEGTLMTFSPDPRKNKVAAPIVKRFRAAGFEPEAYTLYTYGAIQAWAQAVKTAKTTNPDAVAGVLRRKSFSTVLGKFGFDKKGDPTAPGYVWYVWKNGDYDYRY